MISICIANDCQVNITVHNQQCVFINLTKQSIQLILSGTIKNRTKTNIILIRVQVPKYCINPNVSGIIKQQSLYLFVTKCKL